MRFHKRASGQIWHLEMQNDCGQRKSCWALTKLGTIKRTCVVILVL